VVESGGDGRHAYVVLEFLPQSGPALGLSARLEIRLQSTLRLKLTTRNSALQAIGLTAALHTYLAVGDIAEVAVEGLGGVAFIDKMAGGARRSEKGILAIDREIDRIYATGGPVKVLDRKARRQLTVSSRGSSTATVVWNPWIEKAARLGDMPPGDYRHMLCVETAHAGDDVRLIEPGTDLCLETEISGASLV
jgi:glucose-6-phosphate 1-epimerase